MFSLNCYSDNEAATPASFKLTRNKSYSWQRIEAMGSKPTPRSLHSGVVVGDFMYIFGGYDGTQRINDFFRYNFKRNDWEIINSNSPPPSLRDRHSAVSYSTNIYIFGGYDGINRVNDLFEYSIEENSWREIISLNESAKPSPRHSQTAVVYQRYLYIFGGYDGIYKNDFYQFDLKEKIWNVIRDRNPSSENWPTPRYRTSSIVYMDKLYIYGGHDGSKHLNDFYSFDFEKQQWSFLNQGELLPSPRDSHVAVLYKDSMFIFGGSTGFLDFAHRNEFFEYDFNEQKWNQVKVLGTLQPSNRFCHVGVIFNSSFYVFGGYDGTNRLNDFYKFNFEGEENDKTYPTLIEDLKSYVNNDRYSDIILEFDDNSQVFSHKLILSRSPYFEAMFSSTMKESSEKIIHLKEVNKEAFLSILNFLYTDKLELVSMEAVEEVYNLADMFSIDKVLFMCEYELIRLMSVENVSYILLTLSKRKPEKAYESVFNFVLKNFDQISKSKGFELLMKKNLELGLEILKKR